MFQNEKHGCSLTLRTMLPNKVFKFVVQKNYFSFSKRRKPVFFVKQVNKIGCKMAPFQFSQ